MSVFENQKCPVCSSLFKDGDDIVVCPVCGTPCHRECYRKTGACPNKALHSGDFSYAKSLAGEAAAGGEAAAAAQKEEKAAGQSEYMKCEHCGAEIRRGAMFCTKCGARQAQNLSGRYSPDPRLIVPTPAGEYERSSEEIDGVSLADAATVVNTNCGKFIKKFLKNKKANWNWSALIFGEYYYFYRKMALEGVLILIVRLILNLVTFTVFADRLAALNGLIGSVKTWDEVSALVQSSEYLAAVEQAAPVYLVLLGVGIVINIFCALFADSTYRRRVIKTVKKVDEQLDGGNMFAFGTMVLPQEQINSRDLRRALLARKGGVNIFLPVLAYFVFQIVASLLGL